MLPFYNKVKRKTEDQVIFLKLFTVCSSCKRKLVVCLFVNKETKGNYLFANGPNGPNRPNKLNGLSGLAHL